jgi:dsDNA-binding SOS-regulon protein
VQVVFEELILTCYTNPVVFVSEERTDYRMAGFKDKLCTLIGKSVQSVSEKLRDELAIYFDDGDSMTISLRFEDAGSVEAAMLNEQNGSIFDVWRYE